MSVVDLVKGCPLFHEIYDYEIESIVENCYVATYERGDKVIKAGDTSNDIGILLAGSADIYVPHSKKDIFIATLRKGDLFGEMVLINETKRTADIIARENCEVLIIGYDNFYSFYQKKPKIFAIMVLNITRLITKRLKLANELIQQLNSVQDGSKVA